MSSKANDAERERATQERRERAINELVTRYSLEELREYRHIMGALASSRFGSFDAAEMPLGISFPKQKLELIDEAIKKYQTFELDATAVEIKASGVQPHLGFLTYDGHCSIIDNRNSTANEVYKAIRDAMERGGYRPGDDIIIEGTVRLKHRPED